MSRRTMRIRAIPMFSCAVLLACAGKRLLPAPIVATSAGSKPVSSASAPTVPRYDPVYSFTLGEPDSVMLPCALPFREASFDWKGTVLAAQLPGRQILTARQRARLADGFALTIAVRVYVFPRPAVQPVSVGARTCRLVYDLWQKDHSIIITQNAQSSKKLTGLGLDAAMRACFRDLVIGDQKQIGTTPTIVATIVDIDPRDALLEEIKKVGATGYGAVPAAGPMSGTFESLFCGPITGLKYRTQVFQPD